VHYWADLLSVHGFRCYDNIDVFKLIALHAANAYSAEREMSASACTRSTAGKTPPPGATRHKIGHFGDVLPSQSLGLVLKKAKPNTTKASITGMRWQQKPKKNKPKFKENLSQ